MDIYKYFLFPDSKSNSFGLALNSNISIISSALIDLMSLNKHKFRFYKIHKNKYAPSENQFLVGSGKSSLFYFELFMKAKVIDRSVYPLIYSSSVGAIDAEIINKRIVDFYKKSNSKHESLLSVIFFMLSIDQVSMALKLINLANERFSEVDLINWHNKILFDYSYNHKLISQAYINDINYLIKKGNELYSHKDYKASLYYFEKVINFHGRNDYLLKFGLACRNAGDFNRSISAFNKYIRLNPEKHTGFYLRGLVSLTQMKYREALVYYDIAINMHPLNKSNVLKVSINSLRLLVRKNNLRVNDFPLYNNLKLKSYIEYTNLNLTKADIYYSLGDLENSSLLYYKISSVLRPDLYISYEKLFEINKSLFLKAVKKLDGYLLVARFLGRFNLDNVNIGRFKKYIQTLYVTRGRISMLQIDRESAEQNFMAGMAIHENIKAREWLAYLYLWSQRYEESLNLYKEILVQKPNKVSVIINIIRVYLEKNELVKAGEYLSRYNKLLTKNKNKDKSHLVRRNYHYAIGDIEGAWLVFRDRKICDALRNDEELFYTHNILDLNNTSKTTLVLSEWGPGDELRWSSVYPELSNTFSDLYIGCEPRLYSLFQRSFPKAKFIPINKRIRGPIKHEQVKHLSKVKSSIMTQVLDSNSYSIAKNMDQITLISDVLGEIRKDKISFKPHQGLLKFDKVKYDLMLDWLQSLPKNKINIGICWKSGLVDVARSVHYSELSLWKKVFELDGINFINLQYSNYEADLNDAKVKWGVDIFIPPINLKDDFESVAALMKQLDLVISPATAVAELAGMLGVKTLLFSNSPEIDWRVDESGVDLWHSSINHICATRSQGMDVAQTSIVDQIYSYIKKRAVVDKD